MDTDCEVDTNTERAEFDGPLQAPEAAGTVIGGMMGTLLCLMRRDHDIHITDPYRKSWLKM